MRRLLALGLAALAVPASAPAKERLPGPIRVCGVGACRTVAERRTIEALFTRPSLAVRPGPFYVLRHGDLRMYFVPSALALRDWTGVEGRSWYRLDFLPSRRLQRLARDLRPFPPPRLALVEVGRRRARDPASYLTLYRVGGAAAADPAGPRPAESWPAAGYAAWASYYARVQRYWIPVNLWSARPTPWSDGQSFLWVSRRGSLLRRDGQVIRIPGRLGACVRRASSLRGCA